MSEKELLEAITHHFDRRREELREAAHKQAAGILSRAEGELERLREGILAEARRDVSREESGKVHEALLAVRRDLVRVRHEAVQRIMSAMDEKLAAVPDGPNYPAVLRTLLEEVLQEAADPVVVHCRKSDTAAVTSLMKQLGRQGTVVAAEMPWGGVDVSTDNGRVMRRNSIASRRRMLHAELLREAGRALGESGRG